MCAGGDAATPAGLFAQTVSRMGGPKEQKHQAPARRLAREAKLRAQARQVAAASLTTTVAAIALVGGAVVATEDGAAVATEDGAVVSTEDGVVVATEGSADHTGPVAPARAGTQAPSVLLRYIVLCRVIDDPRSTTNFRAPSKARRSPGGGS